MPYHDGTGPFGDGRPGRGLGPCGRFGVPARGGFGRGFGRGSGFGRGMGFRARRCWWAPYGNYSPRPADDIYPYTREDLLAQKDELEKQLKWLSEQIENFKES